MPCGIPCRVGYLLLGDDPCARDVTCSACRRVGRVLGDPSGIGKADVQELLQHVHLQSRHTVGHVVCGMPRVMFYVSQEPLQRASARPCSALRRCDATAGRNGAVGAGLAAGGLRCLSYAAGASTGRRAAHYGIPDVIVSHECGGAAAVSHLFPVRWAHRREGALRKRAAAAAAAADDDIRPHARVRRRTKRERVQHMVARRYVRGVQRRERWRCRV